MLRQRVREWTENQTPALVLGAAMLTAYAIAFSIWWVMPPIEPLASGRGIAPLIPFLVYLAIAVVITHWLWQPAMDRVVNESEHTKR